MNREEMQKLAEDLIDCMPPQPVEIVAITGEMFTTEALAIARLYDIASNGQRAALDVIAKSFRLDPPRRPKRKNA